MPASVTVHHKAFGDPRISRLAELAGYSRHEALGRLVLLWSRCTELQTGQPGTIEIEACLGDNGDTLLVRCGLGERMSDGEVRVKGCEGSIEWFGELPAQQAKAGKARAATAKRDEKGRLISSDPDIQRAGQLRPADVQRTSSAIQRAGSSGPAGIQPEPAQDPDPDPDLPEDPPAPARARAMAAVAAVQTAEPDPPEPLDKALERSNQELRERQQLRSAKWQKLEETRAVIARELGVEIRPLAAQDPGERSLAMRIREAPSLERAAADVDHVIAVYAAEARSTRSVQWLTGAMFEERSWRRALGMTLADAAKQQPRAGPRGAPPRNPEPEIRRIKTLSQD